MTITTQTGATFEVDGNRYRRTDTNSRWGACRLITAVPGQPARLMVHPAGEDVWGYLVTTPVTSVTS